MFILRTANFALALLVVSAPPASAQQNLVCTANVANPTQIRAEGLTELIGDIVMVCTGLPPLPTGAAIPQVDVTVTLGNSPITSRILDPHTRTTDALLLVNEPGSPPYFGGVIGYGPNAPQILCPTPLTGCPEQIGYLGSDPVPTLPGVATPPAVQDAPNVFQGVLTSPNQVTFFGVPVGPVAIPTNGLARFALVFRITNLRASSPVGPAFYVGAGILAGLSTSPSLPLQSPVIMAANVFPGLVTRNGSFNFVPCSAGSICPLGTLRFTEGFAAAAKTRLAGAAQNVPGMVYGGSESGFYAPAMVNANPAAPIGLADFGTRLKATLQLPPGVRLWVGTGVLPPPYGYANVTLTMTETGPFQAVPAAFGIDGRGVAELPIVNGIATAVWEVLYSNPVAQENFDFPVYVSYADGVTPSAQWTFRGSFAPTSPPDVGGLIPRFGSAFAILLPAEITLAPGNTAPLPFSLTTLAGPGGVALSLVSSDPSVATVTPSAVVFGGAGAPDRRFPAVTAWKFGRTFISVAAPGYQTASTVVNVTIAMMFSPTALALTTNSRQARPLLVLSAPAPAGGLTVALSSDNPGVAAVPATVFIPADALSVAVPVKLYAAGAAAVRAHVSPYVADAVLSVTVTPAAP